MSNTEYTEMPAGTTAQYPDLGFLSQTEAKPYAHSLRTLLQNENKCLVCWSPNHRMYSCPDRSAAMKADMDKKQYVPPPIGIPVNTKLTLQDTVKSCMKADCHSVVAASIQKNLDCLAGPVAISEPISLGAGLTGREKLPEEPTGDVAETEQSTRHTSEQHQQVHRDTAGAHTQTGTEMNANSACAQNQNLLMLGLGKNKLKTAHYTSEPEELRNTATETRPFSRDGFAQGSVHKNPACNTDACWVPERPFECSDHRGHHCWMDPPVNMIETALQSYAASKQQDPSNTSMCILVPVMRKASWWKKIRNMKRIRLYPKGAELLLSGLDQKTRIQMPYRSAVFYDPPSTPAVLGSVGKQIDTQHHMIFNTDIAGKQARVLLDTGASQCFISKDFCESAKMQSVAAPTPQQVNTAGGAEILTQTLCQVGFQLQGMGVLVSPLVVPLPEDFTVILGDDWLKDREAVLNYAEGTVTLKRNERGKKHILKQTSKPKQKRWRPDLMLVRSVEDIGDPTEIETADFSKVPEPYRELVEKYADIWPKDVPAGLPPLRPGVELVIPFDENAIPVASYRVPPSIDRRGPDASQAVPREGLCKAIDVSIWGISIVYTKEGWRVAYVYRLPESQRTNQER